MTLQKFDGSIRAEIEAGDLRRSVMAGPNATGLQPATRLSVFAAAVSRNGRTIIVVTAVTFWAISTLAGALLGRMGVALRPLLFGAIRSASRIAFTLPAVLRLDAAKPLHPLRFFSMTIAAAMAGEWWYHVAVGLWFQNALPAVMIHSAAASTTSVAIAYINVAATATMIYMVRVSRVSDERNRRAFEIVAHHRRSQVAFLLWQTNPHFLFNALNALAALIRSDCAAAHRFLAALTAFYDEVSTIGVETHALRDELALLGRYFEVERVRFGDAIRLQIAIDPAAATAALPALLLQPILENAAKHGTQTGPLTIDLTARASGNRLVISVANPITQSGRAPREGNGLRITHERLRAMYGSSASLTTKLEDDRYFAAVEIPLDAA